MALQEGTAAPEFSLPSTEGKDIRLSDYRKKKNVILYFYPKDDTPGCTQEACDFRDSARDFGEKDTVVLGVSPDPLLSHKSFQSKFKLPFTLLSDEKKEIIKKYGVWKEKSMYGKKYMGVERTTVLIDKAGKIYKVFPKVKVAGHAEEVLQAMEQL